MFIIREFGGQVCDRPEQTTLEDAQAYVETHLLFEGKLSLWYWFPDASNNHVHYGTTSPSSVGTACQVVIEEVEAPE